MSIVGSVSVRVVPSFSGMHRTIGREFTGSGAMAAESFTASMGKTVLSSTARSLVYNQAGENIAKSMSESISRTVLGTDFGRTFTNAFSQGRVIAAGEGGIAGQSWTNRAASSISQGGSGVQSSITQPFTGVLSDVVSVGNATGLSFVNAEASSIGSRSELVGSAAMRPFSGVMEGVAQVGDATGLRFTGAVSSSLSNRHAIISQGVVRPFTGVMSEISSVGNAVGLSFSGAATSSIAQGGATAGQGFMSRLAGSIGSFGGAAIGAAGSVAQSIGDALQGIGGSISSVSQQLAGLSGAMSSVGGSLTKWVTLPAAGAAAAVGGITAAFGWGRLVSLDTAKGQLRGLGYEAEDVERITGQLVDDLEGGMMTMGEATSAAAGAMAAGVEEGAELTKYIQMLDAAVVGGSGTFEEMNNIFARTADLGYLNANNFDMMAQRMPGFSSAMQEHTGKSGDAFRAMLNDGEISLEEFLVVMDDFGGDMALEYAKTWAGMWQNTKNYIGIIGEALLEGVFQRSKEEIGEFIHLLSSEDMAAWAADFGGKINDVFGQVVDSVKAGIAWWNSLDESQQKLIGSLAGMAVAAGPVILVVGKIAGALAAVGGFLGPIISRIGVLIASFGRAATSGTLLSGIMTGFSRVLGFLTGPIGLIIGLLVGVWGASESFRDSVMNLGRAIWDSLVDAFNHVLPYIQDLWGSLTDLWGSLSQGGGILDIIGNVLSWVVDLFAWLLPIVIEFAGVVMGKLIGALGWLVGAITQVSDWLAGLGDTTTEQGAVMTSVWEWIQSAVSTVVDWFMNTAMPWMISAWESVVSFFQWAWENILKPVWDALVAVITWVWETIIQPIFGFIVAAFQALGTAFVWIWDNVIKPMWDTLVAVIEWVWTSIIQPIFNFITAAWSALATAFTWYWENILSPVFRLVGAIISWLWENVAKPAFQAIADWWGTTVDRIKAFWDNVLHPVFTRVSEIISWLWNDVISPTFSWIADKWVEVALWMRDKYNQYIKPMIDWFSAAVRVLWREYIRPILGWISDRWDWLSGKISDFWNDGIKPTLEAFGEFFTDTLPGWVEKGVGMIRDAWFAVANFFREPINWVINTVWNDGIRGAFNAVADAVDSDARLGKIPNIGRFGASSGSRGNVPGYAKGGLADRGWAMVGEEGPELVNFSNPGRVYTADETRSMLSGGAEGVMPMGGGSPWYSNSELELGRQAGRDAVGGALADAWDWVRGKLADGVSHVVQPLLDDLGNYAASKGSMGQLAVGMADWGFNSVLDWARGKDDEAIAGGQYDGEFTANPGGFNRPAQGMISSMAGPRAYSGRYGNMHYGVDIANSVGSVIRAAWDGVVKRTFGGGLNRTMILNHGNFDTAYLHNSGFLATPGQEVSGGQPIARMGSAGTGPHLHFEVHPGGWYNPSIAGVNRLFGSGGGGGGPSTAAALRDKGGLMYEGIGLYNNQTGGPEYISNQNQFDNLNRMAEMVAGGEVGAGLIVNQYGLDGDNARANVNEFMRAKRRLDRGGKYPAGVSA